MIDFYLDARKVARSLLGSYLVRRRVGGSILRGKIVETEAYPGPQDQASHAANGLHTCRNNSMFLEGGHAYVYLIYGMYHCVNVSCGPSGFGSAVLIRSLEPIEGIKVMKKLNPTITIDRNLCRGPGRLCKSMDIDMRHNGKDLQNHSSIWIESKNIKNHKVITGPRVGISKQNKSSNKPWRYGLFANKYVSLPSI